MSLSFFKTKKHLAAWIIFWGLAAAYFFTPAKDSVHQKKESVRDNSDWCQKQAKLKPTVPPVAVKDLVSSFDLIVIERVEGATVAERVVIEGSGAIQYFDKWHYFESDKPPRSAIEYNLQGRLASGSVQRVISAINDNNFFYLSNYRIDCDDCGSINMQVSAHGRSHKLSRTYIPMKSGCSSLADEIVRFEQTIDKIVSEWIKMQELNSSKR